MPDVDAPATRTDRSPQRLPRTRHLAALGAVLCLYRARPGGELAGWAQAVRAEACSRVDSDGLRERLVFYDSDDRDCWQLYLLPDSDFLAWERLAAQLPQASATEPEGIAERLWRRLANGLHAAPWQASVLRLQVPRTEPGFAAVPDGALAACLATVSELGAAVAARIARSEGVAHPELLRGCCCERATRAAAGMRPVTDPPAAEPPWSLIRLKTRIPR